MTVIGSKEIAQYGWRNLAEVLNSVRGFNTTYDRYFHHSGIRGFLPPGDYNIAAVQEGDDADWSEPDALEKLRSFSAEVRVGLGDKKTVQLKVIRPGT